MVVRFVICVEREPKARTQRYTAQEIRDLRALAELDPREEVRQAAAAVLRYGLGETLENSVVGTPYGIGWIRGLLRVVEAHGVEALRTRDYRRAKRTA